MSADQRDQKDIVVTVCGWCQHAARLGDLIHDCEVGCVDHLAQINRCEL